MHFGLKKKKLHKSVRCSSLEDMQLQSKQHKTFKLQKWLIKLIKAVHMTHSKSSEVVRYSFVWWAERLNKIN